MLFFRALVWEYAIASVLSFSRVFDDLYQLRLAISFELSYDLVVFLRYKESDNDEDEIGSLMAELNQINK